MRITKENEPKMPTIVPGSRQVPHKRSYEEKGAGAASTLVPLNGERGHQ